MIWLKIRNSPAPSSLADSTIALENVALRYRRMNKTVRGDAIAGIISMESILIRWNLYTSW